MNGLMVAAKLAIPSVRSDLVERPGLHAELNAGIRRKVTLISAPAGYGKSTLVAAWLRTVNRPYAWYTVDENDNDPATFTDYLIAAFARIDEAIARSAEELLQSSPIPRAESLMSVLSNAIIAFDRPFILVLDDYHRIENSWVHAAMQFLIDNQPTQLHLVLNARQDPPFALSRLRVRDEMTEIRVNRLRLDRDEAVCFLNRSMALELSDENIDDLEARTEGWPAGLQLAALALRNLLRYGEANDVDTFVREFRGTHSVVYDYLADEVIRRQTPEIREFLEQTSILKRFTAPLCNAITGRADSAMILRRLTRENLFLQPLDGTETWYRYHALFADFISAGVDAARLRTIHRSAAHWFTQHEFWDDAISHSIASGEYIKTVEIIVASADYYLHRGSFATLKSWINVLPDLYVNSSAELSVIAGFLSVFTSHYDEAVEHVMSAEHALVEAGSSPCGTISCEWSESKMRGRLAGLKAQLALCSEDLDSAVFLSKKALSDLDAEDYLFRDLVQNVLGQSLEIVGDLRGAVEVYRDALGLSGNPLHRRSDAVTLTNLILALNLLGRRREAVSICRDFFARAASGEGPDFFSDALCLGWSMLSYEANELIVAEEQASRALMLCERANVVGGVAWARYILALINAAKGESAQSLEIVKGATGLRHSGVPHSGWFEAIELELAVKSGNASLARKLADLRRLSPDSVPREWNDIPLLAYVRFLLSEGKHLEAEPILREIRYSAETRGCNRTLISCRLLQARIELEREANDAALSLTRQALSIASSEDYVRAVADESPGLVSLLHESRESCPGFIDAVLTASRLQEVVSQSGSDCGKKSAGGISSPANNVSFEPLSARETEVLNLVAHGLSNSQIGETLYVSIGTVKKHLNNIFSKLDVGNRTQATARARKLGLIP